MTYYGGKEMAESFRTVRKNTILLAEDIPADKYGFRPTADVRTVAEQLAHLALSSGWQIDLHQRRVKFVDFAMYSERMKQLAVEEQALQDKDAIIAALRKEGEQFAAFLDSLDESMLRDEVAYPAPMPSPKTRFEMLLGVKEHEMHHRAQLMLVQRLLGIVPHLSRQRAAMQATAAAPQA